jgi:alkanesulfonate monooxygenase SsuD/methylene tetrahydromethanopterin reductase-like flavin-dependent oxidoreductase (luciferase family)
MNALCPPPRELGFDSVWAGDSLLARPRLDPLIVLASCAAVTSRVTLGTAALTAALRHPLIGANLAVSLDHAAGGRLRLGVGAGFPVPESEHEFTAVGVPFAGRAARLDETVRLWKHIWAGDGGVSSAQYHGRLWQGDRLDRLPPPHRPGGPPVWLASSDTPRVLARVAELYDGWLPFLPDAAAFRRAWERIGELAAACGRPEGAIEAAMYATVSLGSDRAQAGAELDRYTRAYYGRPLAVMAAIQAYGHGSAEQCAEWLAGYLDAGAGHIVLRIGSLDPACQLDRVAGELLPLLRSHAASHRPSTWCRTEVL